MNNGRASKKEFQVRNASYRNPKAALSTFLVGLVIYHTEKVFDLGKFVEKGITYLLLAMKKKVFYQIVSFLHSSDYIIRNTCNDKVKKKMEEREQIQFSN